MAALWLEQLQPASFRGVAFQVDTIKHTAGDNVVLREYPFKNLPTIFIMGEAAEEIKLAAYVIGDDYTEQREALRAVLSGEGLLVHPTAGTLRVFVAGKYEIDENPTAEGGMARFALTFVRAETRRTPVGVVNTQKKAFESADAAKQASADAFASDFDLAGKPGWAAERAVERVTATLASTWDGIKGVTAGLGDFTNDTIASYQTLRDGLGTLVRTPRLLADAVATLYELPQDLGRAAARDFASAYASLFDVRLRLNSRDFEVRVVPAPGAGLVIFGAGNVQALTLDTPARSDLAQLTLASDQLAESLATAAWVQAVASVELGGYDDAMALRNAVNAQVLRLLQRASGVAAASSAPASAWHDAMLAMLSACLADLQARSRDLARLTSYTPLGWMSIWSASYNVFGTVQYADEIMQMNPHITHPLLVPPGVALRVVRRA